MAGTDQEPGFDVGIAGAGQLARMTALAAWPLGIRVAVLGEAGEPACATAAGVVEGSWKDAEALGRLGAACRVVTLENEFVDPAALAAVERAGTPVRPGPDALAEVQDKALQKLMLGRAGLPTARFVVAGRSGELDAIGRDLGWPLVLKRRRLGYDGYGNATCADPDEARDAFGRLAEADGVLVEQYVPFERELAVMVARRPGGETASYPVVETVQRHHVCHHVLAPAEIPESQRAEAERVAVGAAEAARGIGVTGVELFALADGTVLVNELAPRPHNSGHYTIEACETSQFENHLRGVLDLPLGPVDLRSAAAMVNLLGTHAGPATPNLPAAAAVRGAHIHLYGKREVRVRRKMGHVTALAATADAALEIAGRAGEAVGL